MSRQPVLYAFALVAATGLLAATALARGAQPPPDATPGAVGVSGPILGGIDPVVAPGYRLEMSEVVWEPGAYVTRHTHPTAEVVCVLSGAFGFALHEGAVTVWRAGDGATPAATESLQPGGEIVLGPRDCLAFDEFASHMVHTAWNPGDETAVLWSADLYKIGEPFTTFVDERGTPIP
jgi:quercetin dioxygenase-like cupin family protein